MSMAAAARAATRAPGRAAARFVQTRLRSSGGKVLGEEERADENVYIKEPSGRSCGCEKGLTKVQGSICSILQSAGYYVCCAWNLQAVIKDAVVDVRRG